MTGKYKIALTESIPYIVVLFVIGLTVYLNALIVQDNISLSVAIIIGYVITTVIIIFEIFSLILLKVSEVEIATRDRTIEEKDKKIDELEFELNRIKRGE